MKTPDISKTPIVKKFGARGARRYAIVLFAALYAMLTASTAGLWIMSPEFPDTMPRAILGSLIAVLVVAAASLLTRMRLEFFAGIETLEAKPNAA
jgi:integral membrane sensor domain MASE1